MRGSGKNEELKMRDASERAAVDDTGKLNAKLSFIISRVQIFGLHSVFLKFANNGRQTKHSVLYYHKFL